MTDPVALITGVGAGTGAALVRRFAAGGYRVAMLARNRSRLESLEREVPSARSYICDISDLSALEEAVAAVRDELGAPSVLVHNAVRASFETLLDADLADLELNFRVNTTSLLYLTRWLAPTMLEEGSGSIMVTGNTAAVRGRPDYVVFAPTKAAQRNLAQCLAKDLGPRGIHVSYFNIDAVIDVPWTRDRFHPDKPDEFFIRPADIADEVFHVAHQPRSAWSFDVEIRPCGETW